MLYRWRNLWRRYRFAAQVGFLTGLPPVTLSDSSGVVLLSQLQSKDVLMYLGAVHSFVRYAPVARVVVLNDGSLTRADKALVAAHVPDVEWLTLAACQDPDLPTGGTWERLIAIAQRATIDYVVQLDADTLSLAPLPEVVEAVTRSESFTIGTWDGQGFESALERATRARKVLNGARSHVQLAAESTLDQLSGARSLRYVRGCSGFAGFSPAPGRLELMRELSLNLQRELGSQWLSWGSEQVMSNLLVANQTNSRVLPHPAYADCTKMRLPQTRFVHFIGSCRFQGGHYAQLMRRTLRLPPTQKSPPFL